MFNAIHWRNTSAETWLTLANDYAFWLLPLALVLLWPVLRPHSGVDFLAERRPLLTVALIMAWSCWLFPLGRMVWTAYLAAHGVWTEYVPNYRWPYA